MFELYFSDLNEDAQRRLLEYRKVDNVAEMNWYMDIIPIVVFDEEVEEDEHAN